jgi:hypothetical protein
LLKLGFDVVQSTVSTRAAQGRTPRSRTIPSSHRGLRRRTKACIAGADHPDIGESPIYEKYVELAQVQYEIPGRTTAVRPLQDRLAHSGRQLNVRLRVQNFLTVAEVVAKFEYDRLSFGSV